MIFDRELIFINGGQLEDFGGGVVGEPIDLGADGQFLGRQAFIAIACEGAVTATGAPSVTFGLEFSDTAGFADPVAVPLSLPAYLKTDLAAGTALIAPAPLYSKRYVRLTMETGGVDVACAKLRAGVVLDPQTNR
jgi:hypothetical protein